jgi:hypothetical protein
MPSRETIWFVPLVAGGLIIGMALTFFLSPAIGVPLLLIAGMIGLAGRVARRHTPTGRMEEFREQAQPDVEFTERDRTTLTPAQGEHTTR